MLQERRWLALKMLVSKGYKEFEIATSKLTTPQDANEEQVEIIIANAYRSKSVADMVEEEKRLKESLEKMKAAGRQVKGMTSHLVGFVMLLHQCFICQKRKWPRLNRSIIILFRNLRKN